MIEQQLQAWKAQNSAPLDESWFWFQEQRLTQFRQKLAARRRKGQASRMYPSCCVDEWNGSHLPLDVCFDLLESGQQWNGRPGMEPASDHSELETKNGENERMKDVFP